MNTERRLHKDTRSTIALFLIPRCPVRGPSGIPNLPSARYSLYSWDGLGPLSRFVVGKLPGHPNDAVFCNRSRTIDCRVLFVITQMPARFS